MEVIKRIDLFVAVSHFILVKRTASEIPALRIACRGGDVESIEFSDGGQ